MWFQFFENFPCKDNRRNYNLFKQSLDEELQGKFDGVYGTLETKYKLFKNKKRKYTTLFENLSENEKSIDFMNGIIILNEERRIIKPLLTNQMS